MSMYDALKAEADARDAALWREWWPRLERAIAQAVHPCERCGLVVIADQLRTAIAAAREAAGKEDGR